MKKFLFALSFIMISACALLSVSCSSKDDPDQPEKPSVVKTTTLTVKLSVTPEVAWLYDVKARYLFNGDIYDGTISEPVETDDGPRCIISFKRIIKTFPATAEVLFSLTRNHNTIDGAKIDTYSEVLVSAVSEDAYGKVLSMDVYNRHFGSHNLSTEHLDVFDKNIAQVVKDIKIEVAADGTITLQ